MTHADAPGAKERPTNRLALEKSPYLLQHARNPVDWHAWNPETLAKAKAEDRPIFLSIGYATCHWCHVMERESFEDPATADVMNASFLNVKVDREERPDVDQIYMATLLAMHGQGGWPLSVWLTPDLKPFYSGTYFPREPRWGRPGFPDLCRTLADIFKKRRADVEAQAAQAVTWLHRKAASGAGAKDLGDFPAAAVRALLGDFDAAHGGFGDAPKFPRPVTLELLARVVGREDAPEARRALEATLDAMRRGGIYDHVGGGFARYATDARWLVPHFEKMLYDNAQLIDAYVDGSLLLGRDDFMAVAEDVARWVAREMTSPEGAFYSAQDADSEGEEGRFYVFTLDDLAAALGADADEAARLFGATALGNFEGANVLSLPADAAPADLAASRPRREALRERLFAWRERRERPLLDDKILAAWNGLMIGALAGLGAATGERRHVDAAERALRCVRDRLWDADARRLLRRYRDGEARYEASCDDYAAVALGALRVFSATGTAAWLAFARGLASRAEELFLDREGGGYFFAAASPDLVARLKEAYDGAFPSANALMALLHARLGAALEDEAERAKGRAVLGACAGDVARAPHGSPLLAAVALELAEPPRRLLVAGRADDSAFRALLRDAHRARLPGRVVVPVLDAERPALAALGLSLATAPAAGALPCAVLCEDLACRPFPAPRRAQ